MNICMCVYIYIFVYLDVSRQIAVQLSKKLLTQKWTELLDCRCALFVLVSFTGP